ncbi:hypothetical protein [Streptomyces sp. NPDC021212]|uniref:hypothetical protein n=1 Tax=Streptomyces sp. NPDC021212 TaxID=3365118 RepID=UPI0037987B6F
MPPTYDFEAADRLTQQLNRLVGKLDAFITLRENQRTALLGPEPCDNWSGPKRKNFDGHFRTQQNALGELKAAAMNLRGVVAQATEQAHEARKERG